MFDRENAQFLHSLPRQPPIVCLGSAGTLHDYSNEELYYLWLVASSQQAVFG